MSTMFHLVFHAFLIFFIWVPFALGAWLIERPRVGVVRAPKTKRKPTTRPMPLRTAHAPG